MDDSILTDDERNLLEDPRIPDKEKFEMIDRAIFRAADIP